MEGAGIDPVSRSYRLLMINRLADEVEAALAGRPALLRDACSRALAYLGGLADRPVAPAAADVAALDRLDFALPGAGRDAASVLALLDDYGSPGTVASGGPRYFGFVTGGALPVAQAAAWLTAAWDQNAALSVMSPAASVLNRVALRWVTEVLGLPDGTGGGFVTGATMANATCLAAARDAVLAGHGWDAAGQGLVGAPPVTVVAGAQAHTTVRKALGLVGLGRDRALLLPADGQGRIEPRGLPALTGPALVCLQAGNVNTGASDPFGPLIDWAHETVPGCTWTALSGSGRRPRPSGGRLGRRPYLLPRSAGMAATAFRDPAELGSLRHALPSQRSAGRAASSR